MEENKSLFIRAYSKIPSSLKEEIIVVFEDKPYTWETVYFEVKNDTKLSKKLLNILSSLKII